MKILFVSAEVAPFAKVGGLADVAGSLPRALSALGHDVRTVMPAYGMVLNSSACKKDSDRKQFTVELKPGRSRAASLYEFEHRGSKLWLIGGGGLFENIETSAAVYTPGRDAYLFFASAVLEACAALDWWPDVVHCNDWHTGFIPVLMRERFPERWQDVGVLVTIHNLAYQGEFGIDTLDVLGLPHRLFNPHQLETYGSVNFLKAGCAYADQVNTVSPTYAQEIQTREYGCRLEGLMKHLARSGRLSGILNGIDTEVFDPAADPAIASHYSLKDPSGKALCKEQLLLDLGLPYEPSTPLIGMVTRLSNQKGFDLVLAAAERMLELPSTLVVQGLGDPWAAEGLRKLQEAEPSQVRFVEEFDLELAQRVYAGADIFLMPSAFEPCGLGQMIAMRYGTIPLVRKTGGLADTVFEGQNGFVFEEKSADALVGALARAHECYQNSTGWAALMHRAMGADHSWGKSADAYISRYRKAIEARRPVAAAG